MSIAVVNGKILNEDNKVNVRNLLIQGNKITGVGYIPDEDEDNLTISDVTQGMIVPNTFDFFYSPLVDDVVPYTTRIRSKGFVNLAYVPNHSSTCLDQPEIIESMVHQLGDLASHVSIIACASKDNEPSELSELSLLVDAGAAAIYFGRIIENDVLFKQALTYVDMIGVPIIFGPMTMMSKNAAHLNSGSTSFEIGIRGESELEEVQTVQYVLNHLGNNINVPIHFQSISSFDALQLIHRFKQDYPNVTVGVSPFHMLMSDDYLTTYNQLLKFNPPLRSKKTMGKLLDALSAGMIDHLTAIHFPKLGDSQEQSFFDCPFGSQTIDYFFHVVSHCLLTQNLPLDQYVKQLACPFPLNLFAFNYLNLNDVASFIVLKAVNEAEKKYQLFNDVSLKLQGGLLKVCIDGDLHDV